MKDDWLGDLDKIRKEDEAKHKKGDLDLSILGGQSEATRLLKIVDAHNSLRKTRSVLLQNKGRIDVFDTSEQYDRCIGLVWQGPVSHARNPSPDDQSSFFYILVGAKRGRVYVNNEVLPANTPEALKAALVKAARKPGVQKRQ